jgi:hypothetical protein
MAVLVIRPETDAVEQILSAVASHAITMTPRPDVSNSPPPHILYFGHGRRDRLGDPTALIDAGNLPNLNGAVVLAMACSSSDQLGPDAVAAGARAWIGFTRPIVVPLRPGPAVLVPWYVAPVATLSGDPASDVQAKTRHAFESQADAILNAASAAAYTQAVIDSHIQRGMASTFRADGDLTASM